MQNNERYLAFHPVVPRAFLEDTRIAVQLIYFQLSYYYELVSILNLVSTRFRRINAFFKRVFHYAF